MVFSLFFAKKGDVVTSSQITANLLNAGKIPLIELFHLLSTDEHGLTAEEASERLKKFGLNDIAHEKPPSNLILLLRNLKNPFNILLIFLALISYVLGDNDGMTIILVMVVLSVAMRFIQEYRSNNAAEKLKAFVSTTATVIRSDHKEEIDIKYLVPGDVVQLCAGDMIPADVRLISAKELYLSQSSLTGESMPIEKDESLKSQKETTNPIELPNMCFLGTNVLNGTARALVVATGSQTFFGTLSKSITGYRPLTSFDIGVNKVSWLLMKFMFVMVPFVFMINGFTKGDWFQAFLFSLSVAVGLTPEMLPMIVTANLARGAVAMSRHKVIVKRLNSIQNFGAMDVLCTDKTGTLTQDKVILEKYLNVEGVDDIEVLKFGYLNSYYQTGLKNLLDVAVLEHSEVDYLSEQFQKVDEIPFDFTRRRMSVVVKNSPDLHLLICKGAVEEIEQVCDQVRFNGQIVPLDESVKFHLDQLKTRLNEDGLRVLAIGYKEIKNPKSQEYRPTDESGLILMGLLAFLDPPKSSTEAALANLNNYHVQVKVLTGDNEAVTRKICNWVNLEITGILSGSEIEAMSDSDLKEAVEKVNIFVKLAPLQKSRVISSLKANNHTVGFLGDGINDAPALREADIGISVDTAVDIAKESADIIMLEKDLMFLGEGVIEGRRTFANIIKYIKMAVSSNFGNVFSVLGASALLPFLPMSPVQLLTQNLLYDVSQTAIPFDNVDKEFLLKPRKWDPRGIAKFMIFIGPISSIFDYTTFALMWFVFAANSVDKASLFQSGWFVEGLLSQTLIVHMIRTQKIPFIQSVASFPLLVTTIFVMIVGIIVPYSPIGSSIGLSPLPGSYFPWLALTLFCYCALTQVVKTWFIKKFNYWL